MTLDCLQVLNSLKNVVIFETDLDARMTFVSEGVQSLLGYPPDRWLGTVDIWTSLVHPDDRKWLLKLCIAETHRRHSFRCEFRFVKADGQVLWLRKHAYLRLAPDGSPSAMCGILIDITAEKQSAESLQLSGIRYRIAARGARIVVWEWDLVNQEVVWGESIAEVLDYAPQTTKTDIYFWYDHIHPDDRERVVLGVHAHIDSGREFWEDEYRFQTGTGDYLFVESRGEVMRNHSGVPVRMVGAIVDISQRKRNEEERYRLSRQEKAALARANQALQFHHEILAVLSHDLKNPLSAILMNAALAMKMLPENTELDRIRKSVDRIHQAADRMKAILQDLVDLARALTGNVKIQPKEVDITEFVNQTMAQVKTFLGETHAQKVEVEIVDRGVSIRVDQERMTQAIAKTIHFLAMHEPRGANLRVRVELLGNQVLFRITHPGLVLKEEELDTIFEPRNRETDMAIVQAVIRAHGGRIWGSSLSNQGTSIYFTLNTVGQQHLREAG